MSQKFGAVKGMNDLLPPESRRWSHVEHTARELFSRYGYGEVRTPILEDTALFVRSVGEQTDIIGKEMYTFADKAARSLSLRPEGTAPSARAYIEHSVAQREPVTRWFYVGPMFRYERMKTGRYRQFWQIGAEVYGAKEPAQDAEVIELTWHFLGRLGLTGVSVQLNSLGDDVCRPDYERALVAFLAQHRDELCVDCQSRLERNPLRVLDCKAEGCRQLVKTAPRMLDSLCTPCRAHFDEVKRLLTLMGVPFELNAMMVRGLDYYTRTAFELVASDPALGTASAIGGGGRYDKLLRELGGPDSPAVGFALGLDRLCLLTGSSGAEAKLLPDLFIVSVDAKAQDAALRLATQLRHASFWVELDARGGSVKSQMKRADKSGARYALVLGEAELASGAAELRPMAGGPPIAARLDALEGALKAACPGSRA